MTTTVTNTMNVTITPTPTTTAMPCDQDVVYVYDERGEKVAAICGRSGFPGEGSYAIAISEYTPDPGGIGGTVTISLNGLTIATWDCRDRNGTLIPNSFYHFVLFGRTPDGEEIVLETDAFIAPHRGYSVLLTARPNKAGAGDTILFSASFAGTPADERSKIRIYTVAGELVRTIQVSNGSVSWILDTADGKPVASGVYLAVLEGINPTNGQKLEKVIKVMVVH